MELVIQNETSVHHAQEQQANGYEASPGGIDESFLDLTHTELERAGTEQLHSHGNDEPDDEMERAARANTLFLTEILVPTAIVILTLLLCVALRRKMLGPYHLPPPFRFTVSRVRCGGTSNHSNSNDWVVENMVHRAQQNSAFVHGEPDLVYVDTSAALDATPQRVHKARYIANKGRVVINTEMVFAENDGSLVPHNSAPWMSGKPRV